MRADHNATATALSRIDGDTRLTMAFEEAVVRALDEAVGAQSSGMELKQVDNLRSVIRDQRVGMIKRRARMGALGIDV